MKTYLMILAGLISPLVSHAGPIARAENPAQCVSRLVIQVIRNSADPNLSHAIKVASKVNGSIDYFWNQQTQGSYRNLKINARFEGTLTGSRYGNIVGGAEILLTKASKNRYACQFGEDGYQVNAIENSYLPTSVTPLWENYLVKNTIYLLTEKLKETLPVQDEVY